MSRWSWLVPHHDSCLSGRKFPAAVLLGLICCGCNGKTLQDDNPVFAAAPPRNSLTNAAADEKEALLTRSQSTDGIQTVGFSQLSEGMLTGTSIVALVNGQPVFLDDALGGFRPMLESRQELSGDARQQILLSELKRRLTGYIDQEVVLHALNAKVPKDRRDAIRKDLEPAFQEIVKDILKKENLQTEAQLEEKLSREGMSLPQLKESFIRVQLVNGYVATLANPPKQIDRLVLVDYYRNHLSDYTPAERVRFAEIVVRFQEHGGRVGAEKVLLDVLARLKKGEDFGALAAKYSDSLSAERQGDLGWIERGALADKELEDLLFRLPVGRLTDLQTRADRLELYKVVNHTPATTIPFEAVQEEIEQLLLKQKGAEARAAVMADVRARSRVTTIIDAP